jgi:hypothetical protein
MNTNNDMLQTINQAMTSMASQPNQMRIMEQRSALLLTCGIPTWRVRRWPNWRKWNTEVRKCWTLL